MGNTNPVVWARAKRSKLRELTAAEFLVPLTAARDVCLPGVPLAALLGFCFNGDPYNTTGWKVGDQAERAEATAKGRRPFKRGLTGDYGGTDRSGDLHELGWFGVEAGKTPSPVATDPDCPWVTLARSPEVVKVLGREAVTGGKWYGALADQCAVGVANLLRHARQVRGRLPSSLQWEEDDKTATLWRWALACGSWSAGSGGIVRHVSAYAEELAALPEGQRWGRFMQCAAREDSDGSRHRADEYSALRTAQKIEGAVLAAEALGTREPWAAAWLRADGLTDAERAAVYVRLEEIT